MQGAPPSSNRRCLFIEDYSSAAAAAAESRGDEEKIGTGISPRSTQVQTENRASMEAQGQRQKQKRQSPRGAEAMQAWVDRVLTVKNEKSDDHGSSEQGRNQENTVILTRTLNRLSSSGRTVLMEACHLDPAMFPEDTVLDICKALIESGAASSVVSHTGLTALHLAAARGFTKVGRLLLNKGCPINHTDDEGNSALHVAATRVTRP